MNGYRLFGIMCICIYIYTHIHCARPKCTVLFIAQTCADRDAQYYEFLGIPTQHGATADLSLCCSRLAVEDTGAEKQSMKTRR